MFFDMDFHAIMKVIRARLTVVYEALLSVAKGALLFTEFVAIVICTEKGGSWAWLVVTYGARLSTLFIATLFYAMTKSFRDRLAVYLRTNMV